MKWALVTGASGFIGRQLCKELLWGGVEVVNLDEGVPLIRTSEREQGDITKAIAVERIFGVDTVFHLAGKAHALAENTQDEDEYRRVNTKGTENVLEVAKAAGVRRFVFFSSIKAMGSERRGRPYKHASTSIPADESDDSFPDTPYGRSKREAEELVLNGGYVPEPVVLRLCMVYGVGAKGNLRKMLLAIANNRFPPLPEVGNKRSMVHVQDVVAAALLAARERQASGQCFIVSDGRAYSTRRIYEWMSRSLSRKCPRWTIPLNVLYGLGIAGDVIGKLCKRRFIVDSDALEKLLGSAWYSSEKIQRVLGFEASRDLESTIPEMVEELKRSGALSFR